MVSRSSLTVEVEDEVAVGGGALQHASCVDEPPLKQGRRSKFFPVVQHILQGKLSLKHAGFFAQDVVVVVVGTIVVDP